MKILMVCTFPHGGATAAARRQAEGLRSIGENCSLVSIKEDRDGSDIRIIRDNHEITIIVPASSWSYSGRITSAYCGNNRTDISNTWISFWPCETFLDQALLDICLEFDVIHFHWIAQLVSSRLLGRLAAHGRRIVFTGHDMNHFTGGCHYSAGCDHYRQGCNTCPQLLVDPLNLIANSYFKKMAAFAALPTTWLFPSIWLADAFRQSRLQDSPNATKVLYNCVDTEKFHYLLSDERIACRQDFGFSEKEIVFVAGAMDNSELRKGFAHIESAIQSLSATLNTHVGIKKYCVIITFGHGDPAIKTNSPFVRHLHLGTLDEAKVVNLLQAADLLLFSSVEENFSNLILESLMCGCPVFAFRIGGVPDIVEHEVNGWIVNSVSSSAFTEGLINIVLSDCIPQLIQSVRNWRDKQADKYSYPSIARELLDVYRDSVAVTIPRVFNQPANIAPTVPLYASIFDKVIPNDTNTHSLLAANIAKHMILAKEDKTFLNDSMNLLSIPAIYKGFSDAGKYDPLGRVAWVLKNGHVFFNVDNNSLPALCLQVSNVDWVLDFLDKALTRLKAGVNGKQAEVHCVKAGDSAKYVYVWIVPEVESLVQNSYNTLSLVFREASVPVSKDPRGLCILHTQATIFDLNKVSTFTDSFTIPDYEISTALSLRANQEHYLWQEWTAETNAKVALRNSVEVWVDLLRENMKTVAVTK